MWKLLRNLLLAGALFAGVLKLMAWYEVGRDAQRVAAALGPSVQLTYDSLSAGLNGNVTLSNVALTLKRDHAAETYRADRVVFESPNVFWLLKHALLAEDTWPAHFGVASQGLKLPASAHIDPHWFDPATLVPFENAGCAAAAFSIADFRKMDVSPGETRQHGEFRYDAEGKTLEATLIFVAAETASVTLGADVRQFEPKVLRSEEALRGLHFGQLSVQYDDPGFLRRRNSFCAQRAGIPAAAFIDQHVLAVREMLQQHGVEASAEILKLYRRLVENGGRASLLSLPSGNFAAGTWFSAAPDDLLRQLNVTARYNDTPPVMFRLSFAAPPTSENGAEAESPVAAAAPGPLPSASSVSPAASPSPPVATLQSATVQSATMPAPARTTPTSAPPPAPPPASVKLGNTAAPASAVPLTASPAKPETPPVASKAPSKSGLGNGLEEVDRAEARLPPPPTKRTAPAPELIASEPPPPPGSTLALVWKPTVERLPAAVPERADYEVIEFGALKGHTGRFVRLVTDGGKKVEGYVVSVDEAEVELRINAGGGSARFLVPKTRIHEVRLVRRSSPPA